MRPPALYTDMDGVIARYADVPIEALLQPGYFAGLEPVTATISALEEVAQAGVDVGVISACITEHACEEKRAWLATWMPFVPAERIRFVPCGTPKSTALEYVDGQTWLLDDLSANLREWRGAGGMPIKYMNGINGTKGTYRGARVHEGSPTLATDILGAIAGETI